MRMLWLFLALMFAAPAAAQQEGALGYNNSCANLAQSSCILKTAGGQLYRFRVTNWSGSAVVVYLVDSATVPPGSGANVTVVDAWPLAAGGATAPTKLDVSYIPDSLLLFSGITLLCSSTGTSANIPTFTAAATSCTFEGETR
jgi:hypothetical protein